jgi:glutamate--cysteine ligase catalytic subunit
MALTANAPIWRGRLADVDTRWDVIAASVDCRTPAESGTSTPRPGEAAPSWMHSPAAANAAGHGTRHIPKSRYSSIDGFISNSPKMKDAYNDVPFVYDERAYDMLLADGTS